MPLPSEIQTIIRATEDAARSWLGSAANEARGAVTRGAAEAMIEVEAWRARMTELVRKWNGGALSLADFLKASESEKESLAFKLASIPNEEKKKFVAGLLGASLDFLGRIIGAGLGAIPK